MAERLHQLRFDEYGRLTTPDDVTPENFTGLKFHGREQKLQPRINILGRCVREVSETVMVTSPGGGARYLSENIYIPFEQFDQEELWVLLLNSKNRITQNL